MPRTIALILFEELLVCRDVEGEVHKAKTVIKKTEKEQAYDWKELKAEHGSFKCLNLTKCCHTLLSLP